jgi:hypothetical protein
MQTPCLPAERALSGPERAYTRGMGRVVIGSICLVVMIVAPLHARAQSSPEADEPQVEPSPAVPPRAYVPPPPAYPPAGGGPQGYPPPIYAPPSYPPPIYGPPPLLAYDTDKKYPAVGLLLELFVPGLGSVYGDHPAGAAATWGLMIGGVGMMVAGLEQRQTDGDIRRVSDAGLSMAFTGIVMVLCGRVYGLIDSWSSSSDYNTALAARLGLAQGSMIVAPIQAAGGRLAWGPGLSLRF